MVKKRIAFYHQHVGEERPVLVEGSKHTGLLQGFTDNYVKVVIPANDNERNQITPVVLVGYNPEFQAMESVLPEGRPLAHSL